MATICSSSDGISNGPGSEDRGRYFTMTCPRRRPNSPRTFCVHRPPSPSMGTPRAGLPWEEDPRPWRRSNGGAISSGPCPDSLPRRKHGSSSDDCVARCVPPTGLAFPFGCDGPRALPAESCLRSLPRWESAGCTSVYHRRTSSDSGKLWRRWPRTRSYVPNSRFRLGVRRSCLFRSPSMRPPGPKRFSGSWGLPDPG